MPAVLVTGATVMHREEYRSILSYLAQFGNENTDNKTHFLARECAQKKTSVIRHYWKEERAKRPVEKGYYTY